MPGRLIEGETDDIFLNLALDQSILYLHPYNNYIGTVRFWKTPRAVILGRSQEVNEEVDILYCKRNGILITRRISGGGTVYSDLGNLNISISLKKGDLRKGKFNYQKVAEMFSNILIKALKFQYPDELFQTKNSSSVLFQNKKISGSAGYIHREWVLHHLTLLFEANLQELNSSLKAGKSNYTSNRPSKYHPTTNLQSLSLKKFKTDFMKTLTNHFDIDFTKNSVSDQESSLASLLSNEMYSQESWIIQKKRILLENSFQVNTD